MKKRFVCIIIICTIITSVIINTFMVGNVESQNIRTEQDVLKLSEREAFDIKLNPSLVEEIEYIPTSEQSEMIIQKTNEIINKLDNQKNINTLSKTTNENINRYNLNVTKQFDNAKNYEYYKVNTSKYIIHINTNNGKVSGIYNNEFDYNLKEQGTYEMACEFINNIYLTLDLPKEYELCYLGEFDDILWEANFCQICDGIENRYASVKILFSPVLREIAALTVFTEQYENNSSIEKNTISDWNITEILSKSRIGFRG